jgi:hypothetical protein
MRHFLIASLLLTSISNYGLAQDKEQDQCQRTGNKKTRDIKRNHPFDKATSIKIVSFKTLDKEVVEWEIPKVNGQVDFTRLFEVKVLNKKQTAKLLDILININYIPLPVTKADDESDEESIVREIKESLCYTPRHAILFENAKGQVFSYIEICIECLRYKTYPDTLEIGEFCADKYTMLEDFFRELGIVYGIGQYGYRWSDD